MEKLIFYVFSLLAIGTAVIVVGLKNTARALFLFFMVLFFMAGLYIFALADFVAITQILVYVGGVLVLMIFAFMLSNRELLADMQKVSGRFLSVPNWQGLLLAFGFFAVMVYGIWEWQSAMPEWITDNIRRGQVIAASDNNIRQLGMRFMTSHVLAFEVISVFLMMVLIGAAHMARREGKS